MNFYIRETWRGGGQLAMAKKKKKVDELNWYRPATTCTRLTWLHQTQSTQIVHGIGACVCVCVSICIA